MAFAVARLRGGRRNHRAKHRISRPGGTSSGAAGSGSIRKGSALRARMGASSATSSMSAGSSAEASCVGAAKSANHRDCRWVVRHFAGSGIELRGCVCGIVRAAWQRFIVYGARFFGYARFWRVFCRLGSTPRKVLGGLAAMSSGPIAGCLRGGSDK